MLRSRIPAFLILPALLWSCSEPGPTSTPVLEIGVQPQVLVDNFIVERTEALSRRLNPLAKHAANPVLSPQRPWEGRSTLPTTVLFDNADRRFKMWYQCRDELSSSRRGRDRWAYAVSGDGITWEKPNLGLTSFAGSRRNNLIPYPVSRVLLDSTESDPEHRFKALAYDRINEDGPAGILVGFSPDGLRWSLQSPSPLLAETRGQGTHAGIGDTHTVLGWDERWDRYVAFMRPSRRFRDIGLSHSTDFTDWRLPTPVLTPDPNDPPGTQFCEMAVFRDRGVYWGLLSVYHPNSLMVDVQLAFSRDGVGWRRVGRRHPILTYGLPDRFDSHQLRALNPLLVGEEIRVYYAAENEPHALTPQDAPLLTHAVDAPPETPPEQGWVRKGRGFGGLARCRRDGFVSLDSGSSLGSLLTKPFTCRGDRILFNADAGRGEIRVGILDAEGRPLEGFAEADADPIQGESLRHVAGWRGNSDLSSLTGRAIRLRIHMTNSKLYSFTIGESGRPE
jgi:hypothetical protein